MKKLLCFVFLIILILCTFGVKAEDMQISSKSYILLEADSGKILYEYNADENLPPASITKIMTMLLTVEAIDNGQIRETDIVTVSGNAAVKKGSHVFLAEGEKITIEELLKSVAVASGNDASIALAEYLCGSQESFVSNMNRKASELGMTNTNFVNCNGLDAENHYSTARDISIMTRELLKHKIIFKYTTIWMDTIRNGEFELSNTNKLIRFYEGANGMKTGFTDKAGSCISATAKRNGMQLIAVVLGAPTSKDRFSDASKLLNYGFDNYELAEFSNKDNVVKYIEVINGEKAVLKTRYNKNTVCAIKKNSRNNITSQLQIPANINAPISSGEVVGKTVFKDGSDIIAEVDIIADESINKISFKYLMSDFLKRLINIV